VNRVRIVGRDKIPFSKAAPRDTASSSPSPLPSSLILPREFVARFSSAVADERTRRSVFFSFSLFFFFIYINRIANRGGAAVNSLARCLCCDIRLSSEFVNQATLDESRARAMREMKRNLIKISVTVTEISRRKNVRFTDDGGNFSLGVCLSRRPEQRGARCQTLVDKLSRRLHENCPKFVISSAMCSAGLR